MTKLDEAAVAAAWDANADRWAADVRAGYDLYRDAYTLPAFLDFMPAIHGLSVIDLGCGEGANTRRFAELGGRMTGVDLSSAMIGHARAEETREPLGIRYEVGSYNDLAPFGDASFDVALSTMALMDGPDVGAAMAAIWRVLVPGGMLCFSILHPCFDTPALQWLRDEAGTCTGLRIGGYFDSPAHVARWKFSKRPNPDEVEPFVLPRFPRTLSDYLNAVCAAGFRIDRLDEPRPTAAAAAHYPFLARWRQHAPLVLFVAASKPG